MWPLRDAEIPKAGPRVSFVRVLQHKPGKLAVLFSGIRLRVIALSSWLASMSDQFMLASLVSGIQRSSQIRYGPLRNERDLLRRPLDQTFGLRHTRPFLRDRGFEYGLCFLQLRPEADA
jgi:hypothetical protein